MFWGCRTMETPDVLGVPDDGQCLAWVPVEPAVSNGGVRFGQNETGLRARVSRLGPSGAS
eukprot:NODE_6083_length_654_cov_6.575207_g5158_i0.p2 GENE.NODE_6083_length_654_cov_6.575207_g5158_i0~~NODE_6083_length_654_cov_6.575207_g5158_i0.p2  ORF type:complete len:60 (-),score=2.56 NODE_6083_length_654_cov_6.575207_g5158_i0:393-572(-)